MTRPVASDLVRDVRGNGMAPGSMLTAALRKFPGEPSLHKMRGRTPMERLGEVDDIALAAVYLVSPAAVTGKITEVDGSMAGTSDNCWLVGQEESEVSMGFMSIPATAIL